MKKIILITGILVTGIVHAQTSAKVLLNKTTEKMKSYSTLYSTFDYILENVKQNIKDKQSGYILLKGDKYVLNLMGIEQLYDGKKIYNISEEDKEITISSGENEEALLTPTKVLNSYKKGFKIIMGDKKGKMQYIILTPEKKSDTKKVTIGLNSDTHNLISVTEENKEGTKTTLIMTKIIPNFPVMSFQLNYNKDKYKNYLKTELD